MMLVMDSGLGGLSVARALHEVQSGLPLVYIADTSGFPYGARTPSDILDRARRLIAAVCIKYPVSVVVLACNTLSTLCLGQLRELFPDLVFVGTVPAIKVAAEHSKTRRFTLLATPNTAYSGYSKDLKQRFASDCIVDEHGAANLALYAESLLLGDTIDTKALAQEIAPCFHDDAKGKTDCIILGCTHYPLILEQMTALAPWPVEWIDASPAIARQALSQLTASGNVASQAFVTAQKDIARYEPVFRREAFPATALLPL